MATTIEDDLTDLCFLCLQVPELENYLDLTTIYDEDDNLTYAECFTICTQISLDENDNLPHNLCKSCGLELQMSYDFHKKVEESKRYLQQYQQQRRAHEYVLDERTAKYSELEESASQQSEPLLIASSRYEVQDDHHQVADSFLDADDRVLANFKENDQEQQYVAITKHEEEAAMADDDSLVAVDEGEERITQIDDCLVLEEHLANDEFNNVETLDDEDSTTTSKPNGPEMSEYLLAENHEEYSKLDNTPETQQSRLTNTPMAKIRAKSYITGNEPPFICELCGHPSPSKSLLSSHRYRKHTTIDRMRQCPKCDKRFDTEQKLQRHLQRPSCEPYPIYTCEYCAKKLLGLANYNIHLRFHQKLYPFTCPECGKGFMLTVHLKTHIKTKHEHKRYVCEHPTCGKLFQSQNSLKAHMYVHVDSLPYSCAYCEKMFSSKGKIKWHIQKAHGISHSLDDLDRMQVAEEIVLRTEAKDVTLLKT